MTRILIGATVGGIVGGVIGWLGRCAGGACPLTCNPWPAAVIGIILGVAIAARGM